MTDEKRDLAIGALLAAAILLLVAAYRAQSTATALAAITSQPITQLLDESCQTTKGCKEVAITRQPAFGPAFALLLRGQVTGDALRATLRRLGTRQDVGMAELQAVLDLPIHRQ